jgi:hypothetical protein
MGFVLLIQAARSYCIQFLSLQANNCLHFWIDGAAVTAYVAPHEAPDSQ